MKEVDYQGSIPVACPCGATLSAPRDLAGKKARCRVCRRVLHIPALGEQPQQPHGSLPTSEERPRVSPRETQPFVQAMWPPGAQGRNPGPAPKILPPKDLSIAKKNREEDSRDAEQLDLLVPLVAAATPPPNTPKSLSKGQDASAGVTVVGVDRGSAWKSARLRRRATQWLLQDRTLLFLLAGIAATLLLAILLAVNRRSHSDPVVTAALPAEASSAPITGASPQSATIPSPQTSTAPTAISVPAAEESASGSPATEHPSSETVSPPVPSPGQLPANDLPAVAAEISDVELPAQPTQVTPGAPDIPGTPGTPDAQPGAAADTARSEVGKRTKLADRPPGGAAPTVSPERPPNASIQSPDRPDAPSFAVVVFEEKSYAGPPVERLEEWLKVNTKIYFGNVCRDKDVNAAIDNELKDVPHRFVERAETIQQLFVEDSRLQHLLVIYVNSAALRCWVNGPSDNMLVRRKTGDYELLMRKEHKSFGPIAPPEMRILFYANYSGAEGALFVRGNGSPIAHGLVTDQSQTQTRARPDHAGLVSSLLKKMNVAGMPQLARAPSVP